MLNRNSFDVVHGDKCCSLFALKTKDCLFMLNRFGVSDRNKGHGPFIQKRKDGFFSVEEKYT